MHESDARRIILLLHEETFGAQGLTQCSTDSQTVEAQLVRLEYTQAHVFYDQNNVTFAQEHDLVRRLGEEMVLLRVASFAALGGFLFGLVSNIAGKTRLPSLS